MSDCQTEPAGFYPTERVPVDLVLYCPKCWVQHIDAADPIVREAHGLGSTTTYGWRNPPHKSHLCRPEDGGCGHIWRPADVCTNGVAWTKTHGKADSPVEGSTRHAGAGQAPDAGSVATMDVAAGQAIQIAELERENDALRAQLAEKVVSQTFLTGMAIENGAATLGFQGGAAGLLAEMLAKQYADSPGAKNYVEVRFTSQQIMPGEMFVVTVQRCAGKTPHELRQAAEDELAELKAVLDRITEIAAGGEF